MLSLCRPLQLYLCIYQNRLFLLVLEHTSIFGDCNQFSRKSQEKEANIFAGELLVPSLDLKPFVKGDQRTIKNIMNRYWVSREVVFITLQNNNLLSKIRPE